MTVKMRQLGRRRVTAATSSPPPATSVSNCTVRRNAGGAITDTKTPQYEWKSHGSMRHNWDSDMASARRSVGNTSPAAPSGMSSP
ncbi:MAG: hypothetical protein R2838_07055 [Caldilineaceae bacterium]